MFVDAVVSLETRYFFPMRVQTESEASLRRSAITCKIKTGSSLMQVSSGVVSENVSARPKAGVSNSF